MITSFCHVLWAYRAVWSLIVHRSIAQVWIRKSQKIQTRWIASHPFPESAGPLAKLATLAFSSSVETTRSCRLPTRWWLWKSESSMSSTKQETTPKNEKDCQTTGSLKTTLDGQNRQSLVFSERGQLSQAIPQFHVERILHQRTPIARCHLDCLGHKWQTKKSLRRHWTSSTVVTAC